MVGRTLGRPVLCGVRSDNEWKSIVVEHARLCTVDYHLTSSTVHVGHCDIHCILNGAHVDNALERLKPRTHDRSQYLELI
jgi:hypothetical protein